MPEELIQKRPYFSSVRKAREALKERANEILEQYITLAAVAMNDKDYETAEAILWKLLDHAPEDEDGNKLLSSPASKPPTSTPTAPTGPQIHIGIALGGLTGNPKAIPAKSEVIDVSPANDDTKPSE